MKHAAHELSSAKALLADKSSLAEQLSGDVAELSGELKGAQVVFVSHFSFPFAFFVREDAREQVRKWETVCSLVVAGEREHEQV